MLFVSLAFGVRSSKTLLRLKSLRLLPFLLGILWLQVFIQVFNPFWLNFCVWSKIYFHCVAWGNPVSEYYLMKRLFFPYYIFLAPRSIIAHIFTGFFWALHSVLLIYVSIVMLTPDCFDYYNSAVKSDIKQCDISSFVFLSQDCFGYWGSCMVLYKF